VNWIDVTILVGGGTAGFIGWRIGLIKSLMTLVGIISAIFFASRFFNEGARVFKYVLQHIFDIDSENAVNVLGFLLIFFAVLLTIGVLGSLLKNVVYTLSLAWLDKSGGLIVGVLVVFCFFSTIFSVVDSFPVFNIRSTVEESILGSFLEEEFSALLHFPKLLPEEFADYLPLSLGGEAHSFF